MQKRLSLIAFMTYCSASFALQLREPQSVSVEAGSPFEYDLSKEVTQSVTGVDFTLSDAPGWLKLDRDRLFGTPPSKPLGPLVVTFKARERKLTTPAEDGRIVLNIFVTPSLPPELSLGEVEERKKLELNVRSKTRHPELDNLAFRVHPKDDMPAWMKLSADGVLSGAPDRSFIEKRFDFRILVSSSYGGTAETRVRGRVKKIPIATKWVKKEFDLPRAKEDVPFRAELSLAQFVDNPESARLRFRFLNPAAAWPELSWDGALRGIPRRKDIGKKVFEVEMEATVDGQSFKDTAKITIDTERINKGPVWKDSVVQLPRATSGQKYEYKELAQQVTDLDQDKLSFELLPASGPEWLTVSSDGVVRADIKPQYAGTHRWKVRVKDAEFSAEARLELTTENHPPAWKLSGTALNDCVQSQPYSFDLKTVAEDPDKDALAFEATRLPTFLRLEGTKLVGTPERADVGTHSLRFRVTDGQATTPFETSLKVVLKAYPPEPNLTNLRFKIKERAELKVSLNDPKYVQDPNGDAIAFRWDGKPPTWAQLQENGSLFLQPQLPQVGIQYLAVTLSDGKFSVPAKIEVEVLRDPRPSQWAEVPITFKSSAREPFTATVGKQVRDLDSLPVKFLKKRGPAWLVVSPTGELSGTPPDSALGKNQFTIVADNGLVPAEKTVDIDVTFKNHPPEVMAEALILEMKERSTLDINLALPRYTLDIDPTDVKTFALEKPADWVKLSATGALNLAPGFRHIGKHTLGFTVTDGRNKTHGELQITVLRDPRAPQWEKEEFTIDALSRDPLRVDLTKYVKELDGLKIAFEKRSGPDWFTVSPEGVLSAQPKDDQVGDYTLKVQASNDVKSASARIQVKITFKNTPPKFKQQQIQLSNARANTLYNQGFAEYADDVDKFQNLRFSKVTGPTWAIVDPAGSIFGTPSSTDVGRTSIGVQVNDGAGGTATATVNLTVDAANSAPTAASINNGMLQLPGAYQGELFLFNLSPLFHDAQGDKLTFRKVFGPSWMRVNGTGEITGVPGADSFGQYQAIFEVNDGHAGTQVKAQGLVKQQ